MENTKELAPIICRRSEQDQVRRALAVQQQNGTLPERIQVAWVDIDRDMIAARVMYAVEQAPAKAAVRKDSTFADIGKALAFVVALGAICLTFLVLAWFALTHSGIDWSSVAGLIAVGLVVLTVIVNRSNHSGACPGLVAHRHGCRGH